MTLTRKRLVRVHFNNQETTIEGLLCGRFAGHYVLQVANVLEAADRSVNLDGKVKIPRENVLFYQELR